MDQDETLRSGSKPILIKKILTKPSSLIETLEADTKVTDTIQKSEDLTEEVAKINLNHFYNTSLDSFLEFRTLRQNLETYLKDSSKAESTLHQEKSKEWKQIFYTSLFKLLNECIYTLNPKQQYEYLSKIYDWYFLKLCQPISKSVSASTKLKSPIGGPNISLKTQEERNHSISPGSDMRRMTFFPETDRDIQKKLDSFFMQHRIKDLKEKRSRDYMSSKVKGWENSRPRQAEEYIRNYESARYASKFEKRGTSKQTTREKLKNLFDMVDPEVNLTQSTAATKEPELSKSFEINPYLNKISALRNKNQRILNYEAFNDDPRSILDYDSEAITISAFSRQKPEPNRPHTSLFSAASCKNSSKRRTPYQYDEISEIKTKLARKNILCGIETLKHGLILAEDLPADHLGFTSIPAGSRLLFYPKSQTKKVLNPKQRVKK